MASTASNSSASPDTTIQPGSLVIYTDSAHGGDWVALVSKVDHVRGSWAFFTFQFPLHPEACPPGLSWPCCGGNDDMAAFKYLKLAPPMTAATLATNTAVWAAKVAANEAQAKAKRAADHAAEMESYSHFRVGMRVSWSHLAAAGWGPQPDIRVGYTGTIVSIDLAKLSATVEGKPQQGHGAALTTPRHLAELTLVPCDCSIGCLPGMYCGSPQWQAAAAAAAV
jgi:hypothetical protein